MSRDGINGRFAEIGGYIRERPQTPGPWNSPYWREINAAIDILRAKLMGADGFGVDLLNIDAESSHDPVRILCKAAAAIAPAFRITLEPDMAALKDATPTTLAKALVDLTACPAVDHTADGRLVLIPFAADSKPVGYWSDLLRTLSQSGQRVALIPDYLDLNRNFEALQSLSAGATEWGPRDPEQASAGPQLKLERSVQARSNIWMQPVAPQDVRPKTNIFWEAHNTALFRELWKKAIGNNTQYVHVLTWNDYGETTEISPSSGTQFLFYDLSAYFISWFKLGQPPEIISDAIYYCYRTEIYIDGERSTPKDAPFRRMGKTPVVNDVEMVAMLTDESALEVSIGGKVFRSTMPAGLAVLQVPASIGQPTFRILRHGMVVVEKKGDWVITDHPAAANPAYFGGSSTRAFVPMPTLTSAEGGTNLRHDKP